MAIKFAYQIVIQSNSDGIDTMVVAEYIFVSATVGCDGEDAHTKVA